MARKPKRVTQMRVVDTNVLIVASAADGDSPFDAEATPVEEAVLREQVLDWLEAFEADPYRHAVMDLDWHIATEYRHKLSEQDYGWLALRHKMDHNQVAWVTLDMDDDGHAVLPPSLSAAVTDLADRKMVAAALEAIKQDLPCKLTNASDTDWLDCQDALHTAGLDVENLLVTWLRAKWRTKHPKTSRHKKS